MKISRVIAVLIFVFLLSCKNQSKIESINFSTEYLFNAEIEKKSKEDSTSIGLMQCVCHYIEKKDYMSAQGVLRKIAVPIKFVKSCDIKMLEKEITYINGRANWIFAGENNKMEINLERIDVIYPAMVLAFVKGENVNTAIPNDIVEVESKESACFLGLKKGEYTIVILGSDKKAKKITIPVK